jgi:hypothetical protein
VRRIGRAFHALLASADADGGAVAALGALGTVPKLLQNSVIYVRAEWPFHGLQIALVGVRGELDAGG